MLPCDNVLKTVLVIFLVSIALLGCREQVVHNLNESDVNKLVTKLNDVGIDSQKTKQADGKWSLEVASDNALRAIQFIEEARLLRTDEQKLPQKSSMISSREDQRFQFERATSRELEATLTALSDVLEARVHLNMPPSDPVFGGRLANVKGSASVLMVVKTGFSVPTDDLKALVAGASGIDPQSVSILISESRMNKSIPVKKQNSSNLTSIRTNPDVPVFLAVVLLIAAAFGFFGKYLKSRRDAGSIKFTLPRVSDGTGHGS